MSTRWEDAIEYGGLPRVVAVDRRIELSSYPLIKIYPRDTPPSGPRGVERVGGCIAAGGVVGLPEGEVEPASHSAKGAAGVCVLGVLNTTTSEREEKEDEG